MTELTEDRLVVDLTSATSLFERSPEPEAEHEGEDSTSWDLEWHAADAAEAHADWLGKFEAVLVEDAEDPSKARELVGFVESLLDAVEEEEEGEDDEVLDPDEAIRGSAKRSPRSGRPERRRRPFGTWRRSSARHSRMR